MQISVSIQDLNSQHVYYIYLTPQNYVACDNLLNSNVLYSSILYCLEDMILECGENRDIIIVLFSHHPEDDHTRDRNMSAITR
jgi:hypothetical protein